MYEFRYDHIKNKCQPGLAGVWTLDNGLYTLDTGHWTLDDERLTVDVKTLKFKIVQSFGKNGSISVT